MKNLTIKSLVPPAGTLLAEYAPNAAASSPQKEYGYRGGQLLVSAQPASVVRWLVAEQLGTPG